MAVTTLQEWSALLRQVADRAPEVDGQTLHLGVMERFVRDALALPPRDDADTLRMKSALISSPDTHANIPQAEVAFWQSRACGKALPPGALDSGQPTLLASTAFDAIEVFTDAELSALHAMWWIVKDEPATSPAQRRLRQVRDWHLENTQPDNATNRPWAVHVFLEADTPEGRLYAQTLLHNALALEGRATPLAGAILRDAACAVDLIAARDR